MIFPPAVFAGDGWLRLFGTASGYTTVEELAKRLDHLEHHLDEYGSVVIKTPDVWGESRLMRHRADVEMQLKARLDGFDFRINAIQATRDAAYLATAVALQEQIRSGADVPALTGANSGDTTNVNAATYGMTSNPDNPIGNQLVVVPRREFLRPTVVVGEDDKPLKVNIEPVIELDQVNRYLQHLNELRRLNEGDDNGDTPGYALNLIRIPVSILPGRKTQEGFGAEVQLTIDPYLSDEILPLAFKDFVVNGVVDRIGFDVFQIAQRADISRLKGDSEQFISPKQEVAMDANAPQLEPGASDDIINLHHKLLNMQASEIRSEINKTTNDDERHWAEKVLQHRQQTETKTKNFYDSLVTKPTRQLREFQNELRKPNADVKQSAINANLINSTEGNFLETAIKEEADDEAAKAIQYRLLADVNHRDIAIPASYRENVDGTGVATLLPIALHVYDCLVTSGATPFLTERNGEGVPRSHRLDHGLTMPEVETLLTRETQAAYEFLSQPNAGMLWAEFCTPELARKIREHRQFNGATKDPTFDSVEAVRQTFNIRIQTDYPEAYGSVTVALAWQVLVESALVNERLVQDMREIASLKNCPCIPCDWMSFVGPHPSPEARMAFNEYVRCKWPIHVFALDPVTQDQNIADSFSQRREMQLALAIAASNRAIGGQAMQRYVRRMEYDLETIQLNRTAVAFSHGDNTFGWQFFPRIQTPPAPSNLKVITRDLLIGGQSRDSLARKYHLEPGIRECTALVVMPSFVPQVMVDVRTNWFRLTKHFPIYPFMKRQPGYEDSVDLSREVTELRELHSRCAADAHLYRDGEVFRLCKAVERLEGRLPLQTHNVSVPWENDLGGFEVFRSGTPVLGPEIHGWYGAPGIKVIDTQLQRGFLATIAGIEESLNAVNLQIKIGKANGTLSDEELERLNGQVKILTEKLATIRSAYLEAEQLQTSTAIFLVGKNFSVLNCRVIAGGVDVTNSIQVINRNLMQVHIPSTVSTVSTNHDSGEERFVVVHLATPYGATSRLLIPMEGNSERADATKALETATRAEEAAKAAKVAADSAAAVATRSQETSQKLAEEFPVTLMWGEKDVDQSYQVQGYLEEHGYRKVRFCPTKAEQEQLTIHQHPDGTFEDKAKPVNGQLLLFVKISGSEKRRVGPWPIKDGNFADGKELTSGELYLRIHKEITGELPCDFDPAVELEVTGYFKFDSDPLHIVKLKNEIKFVLTVIPQ